MRILLVEDDLMIGESLRHALKADGYAVDWVQDGETASYSLENENYDLALLDLGLPKQSGVDVLKKLRKSHNSIPVLIITARDSILDRVNGLDAGADDYLVKPFALAEVEARIRALLRRKGGRSEPLLSASGITLNPATKELSYNGKAEILSAREYALMELLIEKPGAVLSRAQIEEKLYGWNEEIGSNAIEVHIHALRKKFGTDIIRNIRGMGYIVAKS